MADLEFVDQHNMVACLVKTEGNLNFHEIVDFLTSSSIHHALIAVVVTEASIRSSLLFNDADGTACLTNEAIFQNLALMGYEGELNKLTFQKALFSPQWKYLIHTILHCLSSKSTSWNEFSTNIASAVICLATNQKFNFSKLIFDGESFNDVYVTPAHTQKVFINMSRKRLKFSRIITPLFPNMLTQAVVNEGKGSEQPTKPQPTPSPTQPSIADQPPITASSSGPEHTHSLNLHLEGTGGIEGDQVQTPDDSPLSGGHSSDRAEGALNLEELFSIHINLSNRVLTLETTKNAQAAEILKLNKRIKNLKQKSKPVISHHRAWLRSMQRLSMKKRFGKKESVSKQGRKKAKPESTLDDSTVFDDLDVDHGIDYMETEEAIGEGKESDETEEVKLTADTKKVVKDKKSGEKGGSSEELVSTAFPETVSSSTARLDIKEVKAKEKGVSIKDVEDSSRPATIVPKDKDAEVARLLYEEELAKIERKKEERQRQDQASVDYIANLYDEALYIKEQESVADFVPIGSERDERMIDKMNKKADGMNEEEVLKEPNNIKVKVKQEGHTESTRK
ncbi:hypothetical protein Tco_1009521, partial [Tanacetum coccineum]